MAFPHIPDKTSTWHQHVKWSSMKFDDKNMQLGSELFQKLRRKDDLMVAEMETVVTTTGMMGTYYIPCH
eukprot:15358483-Ditylum_brightwellii.AAC.1